MPSLSDNLATLIGAARIHRRIILPSAWTEEKRVMPPGSAFPGPFSYSTAPYAREIVDCFAPDHPAKDVAVMKGGQIGISTSVIEPVIGYTIEENPGPILFLTGHADLAEEAMAKVDALIDSCGIKHLIRPSVIKKRNSRTGDTSKMKEFPSGSLTSGSMTNHKLLRQRTVRISLNDDTDAAMRASKAAGNTEDMIRQRLAGFYGKMKIGWFSSPELDATSIIKPIWKKGDQRYFHIHCEHCHKPIALEWSIPIEGTNEKAGITYKLDNMDRVIAGSVAYICQLCGHAFTDANKTEFLNDGFWIPTAVPETDTFYSYHISSLYAAHGMYDWEYYARQYIEANPPNQPRKEDKHQTFMNLVLGQTYTPQGEAPQASQVMNNTRNYQPGTIPEAQSIDDGNGRIVLLTLAADLGGIMKDGVEDVRLDYEIKAWAENGATYSVTHGSIGTFIPREGNNKADRPHYTYAAPANRENTNRSVWPILEEILHTAWPKDNGGSMKITIAAIDTGHFTKYAYAFIDSTNHPMVLGVKGDKEDKYTRAGLDVRRFKEGSERTKLYILQVGLYKDDLSHNMRLHWNPHNAEAQPTGFMNFPQPNDGLYLMPNYFSHFQSEHRVEVATPDGASTLYRWEKISSTHQNHYFDVNVYTLAIRDIFIHLLGKELKQKNFTWKDYVALCKNPG